MKVTRFIAPFVAVGALALIGGGSAGAQTETASTITVVVVTASPQVTTTTTTTTTTKLGAAVTRRIVTCENARNHGEWVSSRPKAERAAAAKSDCGKPHRSSTTLVGAAPTVTTKPASTTSTALRAVTSTTNLRHGDDDQGEDDNDKGNNDKGKNGRGNANKGGNGKAKGKH